MRASAIPAIMPAAGPARAMSAAGRRPAMTGRAR